jgi:hypothetical protein
MRGDMLESKLLDLKWNNLYDPSLNVLYSNWIGGFYANCSMALLALIQLANRGIVPDRMVMDQEWDCVCKRKEVGNIDLYPLLFQENRLEKIPKLGGVALFDSHGRYGWLKNEGYLPFLRRWFRPADESFKIHERILRDNKVELSKTIAVVYRGTDKHTEVVLANPQEYIQLSHKLLKKKPDHRVLIQTDQTQVRDMFMAYFGESCFFLPEMPTTQKNVPIHVLSAEDLGTDKMRYTLILQAVMLILAKCQFIVNHTGNMALWMVLYRGSNQNTFQFDRSGVCLNSSGLVMGSTAPMTILRNFRAGIYKVFNAPQAEYGIFKM